MLRNEITSNTFSMPEFLYPGVMAAAAQKDTFFEDMLEMFEKPTDIQGEKNRNDKTAGKTFRYLYHDASMPLWHNFTTRARKQYYPYSLEAAIIKSHKRYFEHLGTNMRQMHPGMPLTHISLGPGGDDAIINKDAVVTNAIGADVYYGIDQSLKAAFNSAALIRQEQLAAGKSIRAYYSDANFRADNLDIPTTGPRVISEFGSSLGNLPGSADAFPDKEIQAALYNVRRHMERGDHFILGIGKNKNKQTLREAYNNAAFHEFQKSMLVMFKEKYQVEDMKLDDFMYYNIFFHDAGLLAHGYLSMGKGSFTARNHKIKYDVGDFFRSSNSWQYSLQTLDHYANTQHLKCMKEVSKDNRSAILDLVVA